MSYIDNILEKIGFVPKEKSVIPSLSSSGSADPFAMWKGSSKVDPQKAFQVYSGWVYACIRAISEEIQKTEFQILQINKDGTEERILDSELLDIIEAPNQNTTGMDLRFVIASHLETVGNAYLFLDGVKNEKGKPTGMYLLDPASTRAIINTESFPHTISHYEFKTHTKTHTFQPYEIIHFKYSDPANPFEGIGTVQAAAQWIDADNYAMEFNRRFFLNGARIGGFIEAQSAYTTDQLEYIKKSFENAYTGVANAHKVVALPAGTKYVTGAEAQKDMDFSNLMTMMRDRILAAFRVPRTVLGITDDVNRANAEATDYVFLARTILPKIQIITSYFNEYLTPRYGENIYLTFKDPIPENREQSIREMQAALGSAPSMSINEARDHFLGLPPIENGDEVMSPFTMTPLGAPIEKATPAKRTTKSVKRIVKSRTARNAEKRQSIAAELAQKIADDLKKTEKKVKEIKKKGAITTLSDEEFEPVYKAFFTRVTSYEKKMKKDIVSYNAKQEKIVIANLKKQLKSKKKALDANDLLDSKTQIALLTTLAMDTVVPLYTSEGKEAAELLGYDIDPMTPAARKSLAKAMENMSESYTTETLKLLEKKLSEGISEGYGLDQLVDTVRDIYAFNDAVRAERVARTETFRVANEASKDAWKQTGVVKEIKWYTAADERVCEWCEPMHGRTIDIEENFYNKGDEHTGSDGSKLKIEYANIEAGSLHASCRCYTRPETISLD